MRKNLENLTKEDLSYISGFLDGDGSIFSQIIEGSDYKYGFTTRVSIVFFQRKDKKWFLMQLKNKLGFGIIRERKDNMIEYVISSIDAVEKLLILFKPFIIIKQNILIKTLEIISKKRNILDINDFLSLCLLIDEVSNLTYGKNRTIDSQYVKLKLKDKFPVETLQK